MLKNIKLLTVEDEFLTQEQMKMLFEDEVKELYQAYDAKTGLEIFKTKKPDIVLTDITFPGMSGLDMAKKIKELNKDAKIIVISAYDDKEFLLKAINEIKIDYYIIKPIDIDLLLKKLNEYAQKIIQNNKDNELIYKDPLTEIYNRRAFEKKINELIEKKADFTIFFLDLDNFKNTNDQYGHVVGDEVLKIFVKKVRNVIKSDDFFARMGGDEFAILMENIDKKTAESIAEKIVLKIKEGINIEDNYINLSCSIGIKKYENETYSELMKSVDSALYKVKKNGKNGYLYIFN